jgi:glutathione peroxidase
MSVYDYSAARLDGQVEKLDAYRGQVLLIVNTASACGFTPQYAGLEALYEKQHGAGLTVLGFPCNQFGAQEPARKPRSALSARRIMASPFQCSPRLTSTARTRIRFTNI